MAGAQTIAALAGRGAPVKREIEGKTPEFHGQRSNIACFSCFYDSPLRDAGLFRESLGKPLAFFASKQALAIGLTQVTGFMIFQTWALVEGGAGKTAVLIFTMPIWTLLLAWFFLGERIRGKQWLAAASTLTGLIIVIEPWDMNGNLFSKFLGVMAAICWASGTILIKRLCSATPVDLLTLTASQMIFGAIPLLVLSFVIPEHSTNWSHEYFGILAFMSIISTALCWWLWIYILDRVPAWEASLSVLGTPVVAIFSSHLAFGEDFKSSEIAGILLIGGGLVLLSFLSWMNRPRF